MKQRLVITIAVAAGFAGGVLSRYVSPTIVNAQSQAPKELRAQNFVLVDDKGVAYGLFGFDPDGKPILKMIDENQRTLWSAPPEPLVGGHRTEKTFPLERTIPQRRSPGITLPPIVVPPALPQ